MSSVHYVSTGNDEAILRNDGAWLRSIVDDPINLICEISNSDCTIIRTEAGSGRKLLLQGFKFRQSLTEQDELAPPTVKPKSFWDKNPFDGCFHRLYADGALMDVDEPESYSRENIRFLTRVRSRLSFPLALDHDLKGLAVLVQLDNVYRREFGLEQAALFWALGQLAIDVNASNSVGESEFHEVAKFLPLLPDCISLDQAAGLILGLLCSGRGLGWNRVWIFSQRNDRFECLSCQGEVTHDAWRSAVRTAASADSLFEEMASEAAVALSRNDQLQHVCADTNRFQLPNEIEEQVNATSNTDPWYHVPKPMGFDARSIWNNTLTDLCNHHGLAYLEDQELYTMPVQIGADQYMAVLSHQCYAKRSQKAPVVETAIFWALVSNLLSDSGRDSCEGKSAANTEFSRVFSKWLMRLNITPVSEVEFDRAKVRICRTTFLNDDEHRSRIISEMVRRHCSPSEDSSR